MTWSLKNTCSSQFMIILARSDSLISMSSKHETLLKNLYKACFSYDDLKFSGFFIASTNSRSFWSRLGRIWAKMLSLSIDPRRYLKSIKLWKNQQHLDFSFCCGTPEIVLSVPCRLGAWIALSMAKSCVYSMSALASFRVDSTLLLPVHKLQSVKRTLVHVPSWHSLHKSRCFFKIHLACSCNSCLWIEWPLIPMKKTTEFLQVASLTMRSNQLVSFRI